MSSEVNQKSLNLAWGVHRSPVDAPRKLVLACLQYDAAATAKALDVAMKAGGRKLAYMAAHTGLSESYVSLLRSGRRRMTAGLVEPLCAATGSNLLRQHRAMQRALEGQSVAERLADLLRAAA